MDLGDGRGRRTVKSSKPSPLLVFTVPFSDEEILLADDPSGDGGLGIIYHPRKMGVPIPWKFDCPHCTRSLQPGLDIAVKRAVKILCSRRVTDDVEEYRLPTNGEPCSISCRREPSQISVKISQGSDPPFDAVWKGGKIIVQTGTPAVRSKIVNRALKFLDSMKPYSVREMHACLLPVIDKQRRDGIDTLRRFPCLKIDWAQIVEGLG